MRMVGSMLDLSVFTTCAVCVYVLFIWNVDGLTN